MQAAQFCTAAATPALSMLTSPDVRWVSRCIRTCCCMKACNCSSLAPGTTHPRPRPWLPRCAPCTLPAAPGTLPAAACNATRASTMSTMLETKGGNASPFRHCTQNGDAHFEFVRRCVQRGPTFCAVGSSVGAFSHANARRSSASSSVSCLSPREAVREWSTVACGNNTTLMVHNAIEQLEAPPG
jgi:hypothetical protein